MSTPVKTAPPTPAEASNRVQVSWTTRLLGRPEVGALVAAIVIFIFFLIVAPAFRTPAAFFTVLYQSSTIGIVAVGVGMLMIGGEFDLSAGVLVTTAGLVNGMLCYQLGLNLWVGVIISLIFCLGVGFINGYLVMRTGIPSFLITLGMFFVLQGANLGVTKLVTGSVSSQNISQMDGFSSLNFIFAHEFKIGSVTLSITVIWWLLVRRLVGLDPAADKDRQLDLCGRWQRCQRPRRRRAGNPGKDRPVHDGVIPVLVHRHALPLPVRHSAGWQRRGQRVPLHHRRSCGRDPADRRLRQRVGCGHRRIHLRHDQPVHRLCRLGPELVQGIPRRHAAARRDGQPVCEATLHDEKGGHVMTDTLQEHADPTLHKGEPLVEMIDVGKTYGAIRALTGNQHGRQRG